MFKNTLFTALLLLMVVAVSAQTALWNNVESNIYNTNLQGNVGIGTLTPTERLTVAGNALFTGGTQTAGILLGSQAPEIAYPFDYESIGVAKPGFNLRLQSPNAIFFHTNISGEEADEAVNKVSMSILKNGNVGIGTLNPRQSLEVFGSIALSDSTGAVEFTTGDTVRSSINWNGTDLIIENNDSTNQADILLHAQNGNIALEAANEVSISGKNIEVGSANEGNGVVKTYGKDGQVIVNLFAQDEGSRGRVQISDENGLGSAVMGFGDSGYGLLGTYGKNGTPNFFATSSTSTGNNGRVSLYNSQGAEAARLFAETPLETGALLLFGRNRTFNTLISNDASGNRGNISVHDEIGAVSTSLSVFPSRAGRIATHGPNRSINFYVATTNNPNHGYVSVGNSVSAAKAAMYVEDDGRGIVFADMKNFRMAHPTQEDKAIWYASLEGPEAAAYERGVGQLKNGEAFIEFSEHFQIVVNPETMTVTLTPHSADTYGLAVIEKTAKGILVKELKSGNGKKKGNFKFDWKVIGVRKGYEDYKVIRDASEGMAALPVTDTTATTTPAITLPTSIKDTPSQEEAQRTLGTLGQNRPNPFEGTTTIPFHIEAQVEQATILIYNIGGSLEKEIRIADRGVGMIDVDMKTLSGGSYFYTLVLDGQLAEMKQMVLNQ